MAGLTIYTSNRTEVLVGQLADIVRSQPLPPFTPETIVVQSRGMAHWLTMDLADRLRVWANGHFPSLNHFITEITGKLLPDWEDTPLYERDKGVWQIMTLLREFDDHPWFAPLRDYQKSTLKRYQLALQIAELFDRYVIFRPDMVVSWDQGKGEYWQAELWYQLNRRYRQSHRGELREELLTCLDRHDVSSRLPSRISVFGISSLPPSYLSIFQGLSQQIEVHFFLINPCRYWWGNIMDVGRIARQVKREKKSATDLCLEKGNALLASMGHLGRDFLTMLQEVGADELEYFEDPGAGTMLTAVQSDILELRERDGRSIAVDDSIVIHSCHSLMREVEVLHNHLLRLFEDNPGLQSRDVVVMAPDIDVYSPLVETVFDAAYGSDKYIPYSVGDRGQNLENPLVPLLLSFLDLAGSRLEVSRILDILYTRQIKQRYNLSEEDLEIVRDWIDKASIRWGRDREHLRDLGLPLFDEYCWRTGLDRLLLGMCMLGEGVFSSLAPLTVMEGGDMDLLTRTMEALTAILTGVSRLEKEQTLAQWATVLEDIFDEFFTVNREEEEYARAIRIMLREMGRQGDDQSFEEKLPLEVVREVLARELGNKTSVSGYLGGGVTFCSLPPMRAVPFKIVCLMGLSDGSFPRIQPKINFDLIAEDPRLGDWSRRLDDRYLFLEALTSARKQFYISYVGQSVNDNSDLPPSVLVDELLDYLGRITSSSEDGAGGGQRSPAFRNQIVRHRLQPFHPEYFQPYNGLFSYSLADYEVAKAALSREDGDEVPDFWRDLPLSSGPAEIKEQETTEAGKGMELSMDALTDFFLHPVRYFCRNRLGIDLRLDGSLPEDEEPLKLKGLSDYQLKAEMAKADPGRLEAGRMEELFRARGMLPLGKAGKAASSGLKSEMAEFGRYRQDFDSTLLPPFTFEVVCGSHSLFGTFTDLRENGFVHARPAKLKGKYILRGWLCHLVLSLLTENDETLTPSTTVIGKNDKGKYCRMTFDPVPSAGSILGEIIALYVENERRPLPFFSETSYAFAWKVLDGTEGARKEAEKAWRGNDRKPGDGADPYLRFCYRYVDPLDREFEELALQVFGPIYEHRKV